MAVAQPQPATVQGQPGAAKPPEPPRVPTLRQDIKLYPGARHRDGSPSWRILDPVRNRFFEIGWLEFELLARWSAHGRVDALIAQVEAETPLRPTEDEVVHFIQFLEASQLLVPADTGERGRLRNRWMKGVKPWYEQLFHNYLFFRIPLVRPDKFLERTLPFAELFFTRSFLAILLVVFLADLYLVTREWEELRRTFAYFFNLQGGLYFAIAATFSKILHELGHAYAAKRYGVRVPAMGVAFLVMWPFLYTDVGETWKLADRRKQLVIASAGMATELALACFATLLWTITPEGAAKHVLFILATTTWVMTLAVNASPFMRFDGYFVVSDALDFPNLHERSGACARWWIRRTFFGLREPLPEPTFTAWQRVGLVAFAGITWTYRLVVFFGIALMVYHLFFKILGIVMMMMELVWFIFRPVWSEVAYLWTRRKLVRLNWSPISVVVGMLLLVVWLVPVTNQMTAPAVLRVAQEQPVYAPFAAHIKSVEVRPGQLVEPDQVLVQLDAPDLSLRAQKAAISLASAHAESLTSAASGKLQERRLVLLEQIAEALAEQKSVEEEAERLTVRATIRGVVRDISPQIVAGRSIGTRELMMRVTSPAPAIIEAYVSESGIESVQVGQEVNFISSRADAPSVRGVVKSIDTTGSKQINRPLLASPHGGEIAAVLDRRGGGAQAQDPVYRVMIEPVGEVGALSSIERGTVRIETSLVLVAQNFASRALSILVRESGF
ncbi:MAG: efflux RND transporter periplasmic adaptor subunit [Proteobacteria bacterium]|nr:efflux RND transporter periplasmic adaptor subunit [Pseudomonadota bacterium]